MQNVRSSRVSGHPATCRTRERRLRRNVVPAVSRETSRRRRAATRARRRFSERSPMDRAARRLTRPNSGVARVTPTRGTGLMSLWTDASAHVTPDYRPRQVGQPSSRKLAWSSLSRRSTSSRKMVTEIRPSLKAPSKPIQVRHLGRRSSNCHPRLALNLGTMSLPIRHVLRNSFPRGVG